MNIKTIINTKSSYERKKIKFIYIYMSVNDFKENQQINNYSMIYETFQHVYINLIQSEIVHIDSIKHRILMIFFFDVSGILCSLLFACLFYNRYKIRSFT